MAVTGSSRCYAVRVPLFLSKIALRGSYRTDLREGVTMAINRRTQDFSRGEGCFNTAHPGREAPGQFDGQFSRHVVGESYSTSTTSLTRKQAMKQKKKKKKTCFFPFSSDPNTRFSLKGGIGTSHPPPPSVRLSGYKTIQGSMAHLQTFQISIKILFQIA